jgi:glycosyltransferase involved in cell wall biosynthesis
MSSHRSTICLNMIVKNEAHVIERCLASARPLIDRWCIVDTGSTDGTQDMIRNFMRGVPGSLHERSWKNFAHNRNEAMDFARRENCDYVLFIDADEVFEFAADFTWPALTAPSYELLFRYDGTQYTRPMLVRSSEAWRWVGVLHEYLECPGAPVATLLPAPTICQRHDGARAHDPRTYERDAAILEQGLIDEPENARYVFYLAQSYRDAGKLSDARTTYERRAAMGGWDEEVWYSLFQIAVLTERLRETPERVSAAYLRAFQHRPSRAEPLVELARFHRIRAEYAQAYLYAKHASEIIRPADRLFVDAATYEWRALDELGISAFYVTNNDARRAGAKAVHELIASSVFATLPLPDQQRIRNNLAFYC